MGTCFVVMPITVSDEYIDIYSDRNEHFMHVLAHLFTPAITECGHDVIPPVVSGSDLIHAEIIKNLEQADFLLCDISCLNPNVFFELGIRTALDRPVAIVKDDHTKRIPFDTGSINTYTYDSSLTPWSLKTQVPSLSEHIRQSMMRSGERNPLWRYFGLTQRASPPEIANPAEAKLDLILSELTRLGQPSRPAKRAETTSNQRSLLDDVLKYVDLPSEAALEIALLEGLEFGRSVSKDAPALWTEAVLARKPRVPNDLEARMLQSSRLTANNLLQDDIRAQLRKGFWEGLEESTGGQGAFAE